MSPKHRLTIFHCIMAVVVTSVGLALAGSVAEQHPLPSRLISLLAVVLPVLVATRVAWASGYAAGGRASGGDSAA